MRNPEKKDWFIRYSSKLMNHGRTMPTSLMGRILSPKQTRTVRAAKAGIANNSRPRVNS